MGFRVFDFPSEPSSPACTGENRRTEKTDGKTQNIAAESHDKPSLSIIRAAREVKREERSNGIYAFRVKRPCIFARAHANPRPHHRNGDFAFRTLVWRGGRVVECTALEMRHTGNRIGGSNPSLSAIYIIKSTTYSGEPKKAHIKAHNRTPLAL
jgi:hypothetical protein